MAHELARRVSEKYGDELPDDDFLAAVIEAARPYRQKVTTAPMSTAEHIPLSPALQEDALSYLDDIEEQATLILQHVLSKQHTAARERLQRTSTRTATAGQHPAPANLNAQVPQSKTVEHVQDAHAKASHIPETPTANATASAVQNSTTSKGNAPPPTPSKATKRGADDISEADDGTKSITDEPPSKKQKQKEPEAPASIPAPLIPVPSPPKLLISASPKSNKRGIEEVTEGDIVKDAQVDEPSKKQQKFSVFVVQEDGETIIKDSFSNPTPPAAAAAGDQGQVEALVMIQDVDQQGLGLGFEQTLFEGIEVPSNDDTFDALFEKYTAEQQSGGEDVNNDTNYNGGNYGGIWEEQM